MSDAEVLDYVKTSAAALDAANSELTELRAFKDTVITNLPKVVDAMAAHERIGNSLERTKQANTMLQDPKVLIQTMISLADPSTGIASVKKPLGSAETATKTAQDSRHSALDERPHRRRTAADEAFEAVI